MRLEVKVLLIHESQTRQTLAAPREYPRSHLCTGHVYITDLGSFEIVYVNVYYTPANC